MSLWKFIRRKARTYLYRYQVQDIRVRVGRVHRAKDRYLTLLLERRERWAWKEIGEIDYLDLPQLRHALERVDRHIQGR